MRAQYRGVIASDVSRQFLKFAELEAECVVDPVNEVISRCGTFQSHSSVCSVQLRFGYEAGGTRTAAPKRYMCMLPALCTPREY